MRHLKITLLLCILLVSGAIISYRFIVASNISLAPGWIQLWQTWRLIHTQAVYSVEQSTLITHAMQGMLESVDQYSDYLNPQAFQTLQDSQQGKFTGIGVEITPNTGALQIVAVLAGGAAEKVHLQAGDEIVAINHHSVAEMSYRQAIQALQGKVGSEVVLTVLRPPELLPITLKLIREKLIVSNVRYRLLTPTIGYLQIRRFEVHTVAQVMQGLRELQREAHPSLQGIILDLRNNPGGILPIAAQTADLFLDKPAPTENDWIVYSKNRQGALVFTAHIQPQDQLPGVPVLVLINRGTASAAEIVAAALQAHHRAVLVGVQTFGKGSVQSIYALPNGGAIRLTTALYYTPSGKCIDKQGVSPNIVVALKPQQGDNQLTTALHILKTRIDRDRLPALS